MCSQKAYVALKWLVCLTASAERSRLKLIPTAHRHSLVWRFCLTNIYTHIDLIVATPPLAGALSGTTALSSDIKTHNSFCLTDCSCLLGLWPPPLRGLKGPLPHKGPLVGGLKGPLGLWAPLRSLEGSLRWPFRGVGTNNPM